MKSLVIICLFAVTAQVLAFDFKELAEKVAKDKKAQEQIKEAAKKGIEYFQDKKKEDAAVSDAKTPPEDKKNNQ